MDQDGTQTVAQIIAQLSSQITEMQDLMKGAYATTVRGTHIKQDIHADEAIGYQSAMIPLNSKFVFDLATLNAMMTIAQTIKHTAALDEIALEKARGHESPCKGIKD